MTRAQLIELCRKARVSTNDVESVVDEFLGDWGIEKRKQAFFNSVALYLGSYDKETLRKFYDYWSEHNEGGKLMRFEMKKNQPFNINRRLITWKTNARQTTISKSNEVADLKNAAINILTGFKTS